MSMGKMEMNGQSQPDGIDQLQLLFPPLSTYHMSFKFQREESISIAWVICPSFGQGGKGTS